MSKLHCKGKSYRYSPRKKYRRQTLSMKVVLFFNNFHSLLCVIFFNFQHFGIVYGEFRVSRASLRFAARAQPLLGKFCVTLALSCTIHTATVAVVRQRQRHPQWQNINTTGHVSRSERHETHGFYICMQFIQATCHVYIH